MTKLARVAVRTLARQQLEFPTDPGWSLNPSVAQLDDGQWFVASADGHRAVVFDPGLAVVHEADFTPPPAEPGEYFPQATVAASRDGRTIAHLRWPTLDFVVADGTSFSVGVSAGDNSGGSQIAFSDDGASCLFMSPSPDHPDDDYLLQRLALNTRRLEAVSSVGTLGFFGVRVEPSGESILINVDQGQHGSNLYRHDLASSRTSFVSGVLFDDISEDAAWVVGADNDRVLVSQWPGGTRAARIRSSELTDAAEGGLTHGYLEAMAIGTRHVLVWARPASPLSVLLERASLRPVGAVVFPGGDHRPLAYRDNQLLAASHDAVSVFVLPSVTA